MGFILLLFFQNWYDKMIPSWGAMVLFGLLVFLTWWRERGWKSVAESRKETIGEKDVDIKKLEKEKETLILEHHAREEALVRENQTLHTKTDLAPISQVITGWVDESRQRFESALLTLSKTQDADQKNHELVMHALTGLITEIQADRKSTETSLKAVIESLTQHVRDEHSVNAENSEVRARVMTLLSGMEERMTLNQTLVIEFLDRMRRESVDITTKDKGRRPTSRR